MKMDNLRLNKTNKSGFTLLELLIVIGILAILATTVVVVLNPAEFLKQTRDARRMAELATLDKALAFYSMNRETSFGSVNIVYISLPDDVSSTCGTYAGAGLLPALPTDWSYRCVTSDNLRKVNGAGWIPVDFTGISIGSPLSILPIDPLNTVDSYYPSYYSYTVGSWKLTANLESQKYQDKASNSKNISFSLCPGKVKDANFAMNGIEYSNVLINDQCWMKENLRTTKYPNGASIARGPTGVTWNGNDNGYYACPPNISNTAEDCANVPTLGYIYQWSAAMNSSAISGSQGICPNGWHIPTDTEQYNLENYLKDSGQTCNATRRAAPWDCDTAATKLKPSGLSKFEGILTGFRSPTGFFFNRGADAHFWSSSESGLNAWSRFLFVDNSTVLRGDYPKANGFSVRCLKD